MVLSYINITPHDNVDMAAKISSPSMITSKAIAASYKKKNYVITEQRMETPKRQQTLQNQTQAHTLAWETTSSSTSGRSLMTCLCGEMSPR